MSTAICPTCEKELDPARAPIARIRGGHVLTYCSAECAEGKPVVRAEETPARAEETETSKAWYDKADEAIAAATAGDVDALWDDADADADAVEAAAEADADADAAAPAGLPRGYTWDEREQRPGTDAGEAATRERKRPLSKAHVLMLAGAILVLGMVIAIIEAVSPSTPSTAAAGVDARAAQPPPVEPAEEPAPAEDAAIDRGKLAAAAVEELRTLMKSESPRIVRDAALALARTGDPVAVELLGERMKSEPSPHARVRVAYALARAGEQRGVDVLRGALDDKRRDLRMDAARALAKLGDDAGRRKLGAMLNISTHKLGAAGVLALLGDEAGLAVLRSTVAEKGGAPEARMRAAVYLGLAGQAEVGAQLLTILEEGDRVGAANALAVLGDRRAVPALVEQLAISAMRVEASISLRRLDAEVDLEPLAVALLESDEIGRVSAAEAILILTSPEPPAELR